MAQWAKNQVTASKRRCDLLIQKSDNTLAPRGTDFIALGYVFISGVTSPNYALALGTLTNKRLPLAFAAFSPTATDTGAETITKAAHGLETGDGPHAPNITTGGVNNALTYYWIAVDANTLKIAATLADAYAGTGINITASLNAVTFSAAAGCSRGLDGHFTYEATQPELNHDIPETSVIVNGANYERALGFGGYTTVAMAANVQGFESIAEGAHTYGDYMRGAIAILANRSSGYSTGTIKFRDRANTKDRWTFTVDGTGRLTAVANDLT